VLLVMMLTTLWDRAKSEHKSQENAPIDQLPEPTFPVPSLPNKMEGLQ
jgi:hypothetical protein